MCLFASSIHETAAASPSQHHRAANWETKLSGNQICRFLLSCEKCKLKAREISNNNNNNNNTFPKLSLPANRILLTVKEFGRTICFKLVLPPHVHPLCQNRDTRGWQQTAPAWPCWAHRHRIVLLLQSWHRAPPYSPILPTPTLQIPTSTAQTPLSLPSSRLRTPQAAPHAGVLQSDRQQCTHTRSRPPPRRGCGKPSSLLATTGGWFNGWGFHARGAAAASESNDDSLGWAARGSTQ